MSFLSKFKGKVSQAVQDMGDGTAALACVDLHGGRDITAVGESNYQRELENLCGGKKKHSAAQRVRVVLMREPDNRYDPFAVAILAEGGGKVGYLSRRDALDYGPALEELARRGKFGTCWATIRGGWDKGKGDTGHYGIVLDLAPPESVLPE